MHIGLELEADDIRDAFRDKQSWSAEDEKEHALCVIGANAGALRRSSVLLDRFLKHHSSPSCSWKTCQMLSWLRRYASTAHSASAGIKVG